jgi:RNA polymerase subunit RPABC4/transcription elongation factor Spt4
MNERDCGVCKRITEANKDIFWVFARTHKYEHQEEFWKIPYEAVRFCPVCGRDIAGTTEKSTDRGNDK